VLLDIFLLSLLLISPVVDFVPEAELFLFKFGVFLSFVGTFFDNIPHSGLIWPGDAVDLTREVLHPAILFALHFGCLSLLSVRILLNLLVEKLLNALFD
jgi:hypothetical protein